jgi:hypothetical protein
MRNLTRKGKRNQTIGRFRDELEAYGDLPVGTHVNEVKKDEKSYRRVRFLVEQCTTPRKEPR